MIKLILISTILILGGLTNISWAKNSFEKDYIETSEGELEIVFIGHGTLVLIFKGITIHIDPWSKLADYQQLPRADIILITHEHADHLDLKAINLIKKEDTVIILTEACSEQEVQGLVMRNGDSLTINNIERTAVPAYNIRHKRDNGEPFHPKGRGNGYLLNFEGLVVYIAGDTENIPEMADLKDIDIAFLPMNLPYTMTVAMVAEAAKTIQPKILYPYHYGNSDTDQLVEMLKDQQNIEVRIRKMS